ncbi:hypothetical protein H2199_008347 [Coniosporium tulheliwenetii]|uniref:Uncharacterized protein n=1 Tax=Coniosporium tulheliwenetii TaxID=3383036 RepID=A0ACC2YLG2_9PEZI|nr:hypothetical protein H2199_008347 [Cladosporium sp. JES 115]
MDAESNQFPTDGLPEEDYQDEDCLNLTVTAPRDHLHRDSKLPVLLFLHGGAFFLGAHTRPCYSPLTFCRQALEASTPLVFVAANYRLGALGFFHSPEASDLIPPNNGLHDQLRCFEWIRNNIAGFNGDPDNITAIGHIMFAGSPVTMPSKTPQQHQENFLQQAQKLDIPTSDRSSEDIAKDMIDIDVSKIRDLSFVGAPCSSSEILPYDKPTMLLTRKQPETQVSWLEAQIVGSATFDGAISYNMMSKDPSRTDHARSFIGIARDVLKEPQALLDLYEVKADDPDDAALRKVSQFESDIGFFAGALSEALGAEPSRTDTYFTLFDLGNPFDGPLEKGKFATHTWDIVALLGAYEDRSSQDYKDHIRDWRSRITKFVYGEKPWGEWDAKEGKAFIICNDGTRMESNQDYLGETRRGKLLKIAEKEAGEEGWDLLWEGVCRRFLMSGK